MAAQQLVPSLLPGVPVFSSMATPQEKNLLAMGASSLQQVEVMERLKQLMAWQERQKASLLRQQQEQIMQLHEQRNDGSELKAVQPESGESGYHSATSCNAGVRYWIQFTMLTGVYFCSNCLPI